jgi:CBS domain-containing protein
VPFTQAGGHAALVELHMVPRGGMVRQKGERAMIAADVMTREVVTIETDTLLAQAAAVMSEHGIRHLPVLGPGQTLVGIISDSDLSRFNLESLQPVARR